MGPWIWDYPGTRYPWDGPSLSPDMELPEETGPIVLFSVLLTMTFKINKGGILYLIEYLEQFHVSCTVTEVCVFV